MSIQIESNILVVDDNLTNSRLLSVMLSTLGCQIRTAATGEMALESIERLLPDVILLDVNMPGISGYQVCQRLKAEEKTRDIPILFISTLDQVMDKLKAFSVGGIDYISKPFQIVEVQARVKTHLALRQLQKELLLNHQRLKEEMSRAGQIQADLLPKAVPELPGFELAARCLPTRDVGGDFYDWYTSKPNQLTLTLGDVMGKGMPAALLMTTVRATFRALGLQPTSLAQVEAAHRLLEPDLTQSESFVTLFHSHLNSLTRQLSYVDAGHGLALVRRANGEIQSLVNGGIPMGVLPQQVYNAGSLTFAPGDALLLFSDGLAEVFPAAASHPEALSPLLQDATGATDILNRIFSLVPDDEVLPDDLTVLALYCR
jgi:serine phosphatase RsbU (regulator of sigma subunit)